MTTLDQIELHKRLSTYSGEDRVVIAQEILEEARKIPKKKPFESYVS